MDDTNIVVSHSNLSKDIELDSSGKTVMLCRLEREEMVQFSVNGRNFNIRASGANYVSARSDERKEGSNPSGHPYIIETQKDDLTSVVIKQYDPTNRVRLSGRELTKKETLIQQTGEHTISIGNFQFKLKIPDDQQDQIIEENDSRDRDEVEIAFDNSSKSEDSEDNYTLRDGRELNVSLLSTINYQVRKNNELQKPTVSGLIDRIRNNILSEPRYTDDTPIYKRSRKEDYTLGKFVGSLENVTEKCEPEVSEGAIVKASELRSWNRCKKYITSEEDLRRSVGELYIEGD